MARYTLQINGVSIPEDDVVVIRDVNASADYPAVNRYRIREATILLLDPDGVYALRHSSTQAPIGASVRIELNGRPVFVGEVIENTQAVGTADIQLICSGASWKLSRDHVKDFGIRRRFRLVQETEQQLRDALEQGDPRADGVYPVLSAVLPASEGSLSGYGKALNDRLVEVDNLRTDGLLSYRNIIADESSVRTEGGAVPDPPSAFPQAILKSPYRYQSALQLISELLDTAEIDGGVQHIYPTEIGDHFASRGRFNYDLIGATGNRFDVPIAFGNFATDWVYDGDYYALMTVPTDDNGFYLSQLLKYDVNDREYTEVYRFPVNTMAWRLAIDGNLIYMLQADSKASPNARFDSADVSIILLDTTDDSVATIANKGSTYPPQMAKAYFSGGGHQIYRPESRGGFVVYQNTLYYPYFNRATNIGGIASYPGGNSEMSYNWDQSENECGLAFSINDAGLLVGAVEFRDGATSDIRPFTKDLS